MARYIDKDHWEEEILIPNTSTPILGGQPVWEGDRLVDGFANVSSAILADRTRHLKNRIENIESNIDADFSGFLRKEDNLSDLEDIQQAKYNLGLNLVDNTRDEDKPVSTPQQNALDTKVDKEFGKGLSTHDFDDTYKNKLDGIEEGAEVNVVTSVAGKQGDVTLTKTDVGLGNVDNTSDADKPISTAVAAALDATVKTTGNQTIAGNLGVQRLTVQDGMTFQAYGQTIDFNAATLNNITALSTRGATPRFVMGIDYNGHPGLYNHGFVVNVKNASGGIPANNQTFQVVDIQDPDNPVLKFGVKPDGTAYATAYKKLDGTEVAYAPDLATKVDKIPGKGLSTEDFTTAEKNKLASLESSKFKGEFVSLAALESAFPSPEVGSYAYVDQGIGEDVVKYLWDSSDERWVLQQGESAALTPSDVKSLYEANADTNAFTDAEKSKLAGIAIGATANTGTVTSVNVSVPTGFQVSGGPITTSGTISVSFASGYSLPTTAKQTNWDTAFGWGDHSTAGYATTAALTSGLSGKLDVGANAASATKLNTARNINGTAFDGTSNITTSSWGTARTITIGNTGKSVDGSGNVSWSLSDIGAAAASHSHTASQISDSTAVGRGVLTAVDAAAARAAIGAGTSDLAIGTTASTAKAGNWQPTTASKSQTLNGTANAFVSGAAYHNIISWTSLGSVSSGTLAVNLDTSLNFTVSVGGNITVGNPTNADPGKCGEIVITMTANGVVSWQSNWKFLNAVPDIGDSGDMWVVSYKVLDGSNVIASASKVAT